MKKMFFLIAILFLSSTAPAETKIHITNGEWEPYMGTYSPHYGLSSHVVSEAFKLEGIKIEWGFFPWKRSFKMAKVGKKWDASCCWWPLEEYHQDFIISKPINKSVVVFFHLKSFKFDWKSMDDLKELNIGGTLEYGYGKEFMNAMNEKKIYVEWVPRDEQNYGKLLFGRTHIFPNDPIVGYSQLRNNFTPEEATLFTHHPKELMSTSLNLLISKQCKNGKWFSEKFDSGFKKLKESGRFDQMIRGVMIGKYDKQKVEWKE
ncbi:hypothetical protein KKA14_07805 [bacterium]|nr:hypothetical protein [bacterium]